MLGNRELQFRSHNQYALVRLDRQAAFESSTVWYVRAGKGLNWTSKGLIDIITLPQIHDLQLQQFAVGFWK